MRNTIKYMMFLVLLLITINVSAECKKDEIDRLKELANKVEFTYDYEIETVSDSTGAYMYPNFSISAFNLNEELKVLIINNYHLSDYQEFKYNKDKTATLKGFDNNEKVTIVIKGYVSNACSGETVLTKTINLPYYNSLYLSDECKEYPDFKYCKKELDRGITNLKFFSELEKYKKLLDDNNNGNTKIDINYKVIIIIGISLIVLVIVIVSIIKIIKGREKNRL